MGYGDGPNGAILALLLSPQRPPGPNAMGRVILAVPNAKGLADWLKTQGVENREVIPNAAYFIRDPEGKASHPIFAQYASADGGWTAA